MSFFALKRQITRIAINPMASQTSRAEAPLFFPTQENFGISKESVIFRRAWFQKMPQPTPARSIRLLGRIVAHVTPFKNGNAK